MRDNKNEISELNNCDHKTSVMAIASSTFLGLNRQAAAYAATSLAASLMNSVFMFYYVKVFLDLYHVSEWWFQASQVIYMIWNALNDPLFGYIQDNCNLWVLRTRRHTILYGAPLFALSFLIAWFPWQQRTGDSSDGMWIGLHLVISLCAYDAMYTYVGLTCACLFAELSDKHQDRLLYFRYSQTVSLLSSSGVLFCQLSSNNLEIFGNFQVTCVFISLIACLAMFFTGWNAQTQYELKAASRPTSVSGEEDLGDGSTGIQEVDRSTGLSIWRLTWQLLTQRNFISFVTCNLLTEFHRSFVSNFSMIITAALVPHDMFSSVTMSFYYGAIVILPQIVLIFSGSLLAHLGYYLMYMYMLVVKISSGILMLIIGSGSPLVFMLYSLVDSVTSSMLANLMGIPLADIIDEDMKTYQRRHPLSSMVFGTNALVTKPGISLAPMLTVFLLNRYGYQQYQDAPGESAPSTDLAAVMFQIRCILPVVVGILQFALMRQYTIRQSHLVAPKYVDV